MTHAAADTFRIVSIDGGGIRGLVPALLLQDLERTAGLRLDAVHLFAGTSAGSLTAIGLAAGLGIDKITSVYQAECNCRRIFTPYDGTGDVPRRGCLAVPVALLERLVRGRQRGMLGVVNHLLNPRYTASGFRSLIEEVAPPVRIRDLRQKVFAPSLVLDSAADGHPTWRPTAFHNLGGRSGGDGFDGHAEAPIVDAVVASSSAPVDFPPHRYDGKLFVDGGMIACNPSSLALAAAMGAGLVGPSGVSLDRVQVLSLGTGASTTVFPPPNVAFPPPFGALGWMWPAARGRDGETPGIPLASALSDSAVAAADYQVRMLLPEDNYLRVQVNLGDEHIAMDDCTTIPELERQTRAFMASAEWERARAWVRTHFAA